MRSSQIIILKVLKVRVSRPSPKESNGKRESLFRAVTKILKATHPLTITFRGSEFGYIVIIDAPGGQRDEGHRVFHHGGNKPKVWFKYSL